MNMFRLVVALLFLAYGLIIGVLNTQPITLKLLFTDFQTSSGVGIMLSLLLGVVVGGLIVVATLVWPLYAKLRRANRSAAAASGDAADSGRAAQHAQLRVERVHQHGNPHQATDHHTQQQGKQIGRAQV